MAKTQDSQTRLEILVDELDRAREAAGDREDSRVRFVNRGCVGMLVLLILGYRTDFTMAALALPFVAVYIVVHYGYLTHLVARNRLYAAGLESKLNREFGQDALVAETLESEQSGHPEAPNFLGITPANVSGIYSASTIHFLVISTAFYFAGAFRTGYILGQEQLRPVGALGDVYFHLLVLWTAINLAYLVWYFVISDHLKKTAASVREKLDLHG